MNNLNKIIFYKYDEYNEAIPSITAEYTSILSADITEQSVTADYDLLAQVPQQLSFTITNDAFLSSLNNHFNWIDNISFYWIKAFDFANNEIFRGIIKRGDISYNDYDNVCNITSNDIVSLCSEISDSVVTQTERAENDLHKILDLYDYYLNKVFSNWLGVGTYTNLYNIDVPDSSLTSLEYKDGDLRLQDMMSIFFSVNKHTIFFQNGKLWIGLTSYQNRTLAYERISGARVFNFKRDNFFVNVEKSIKIKEVLNDDEDYQATIQYIIDLNYTNNEIFKRIIREKASCNIENLNNDIDIKLNQFIKVYENNYIVKTIKKDLSDYELGLWNSGNPLTFGLFMTAYKGWNTLKSFQKSSALTSNYRINQNTLTMATTSLRELKQTNKSNIALKTNY